MAQRKKEYLSEWVEVDTDALPTGAAKKYETYQAAQKKAREAREAFEASLTTALKPHRPESWAVPVFGYRFGKVTLNWSKPSPTRASRANALKLS